MADIEKVIKGLECCAKDDCSSKTCPYGEEDTNNCIERLSADALELLKEQEAVVRCKDCKHYDKDPYCKGFGDCAGACDNLVKVHDDWFCADGERKETD